MLQASPSGTWLPARVPRSTRNLAILLLFCSAIQSMTTGYDGSMLNGLNILPSYTDYFNLNAATTGVSTASVYIGSVFGALFAGVTADKFGRRPAILWGAAVSLVGIILQGAAQDVAMFIVARIILGMGAALSGTVAPVYLSETFPAGWRAWGGSLLGDFYYIGALIAAGITLGSGEWHSTWAWRFPSLIQGVFAGGCILILPFVPESPRWLVRQGHYDEARIVVAQTNADGNRSDPVVLTIYKEIIDTLEWEKKEGRTMSPLEIVRTPTAFKRMMIGMSPGPISAIVGNVIGSYYLGAELASAGVTDSTEQLKANVVFNVWCLACSLVGTQLVAKWGRKPTALLSQTLLTICLFVVGGLSKVYADNPADASQSLVYGNVATMFLFQGAYSLAWTPLPFVYPPEVMDYPIRANGIAISQLLLNAFGCLLISLMPIALQNIGWKMYMINASWDIVILILIAIYWVETKDKTLEEVDALFDGQKYSAVPTLDEVITGKAVIDVEVIEHELREDIGALKRD